MSVTIKDVAKRARLSQATVSRALNKSGYVSQETQKRVQEAVTELDYHRLTGYRLALSDAGIPVDQSLICIGSISREHGEEGTAKLLQLADRPTAILAGRNGILMGTLCVLNQQGLTIPDGGGRQACWTATEANSRCTSPSKLAGLTNE